MLQKNLVTELSPKGDVFEKNVSYKSCRISSYSSWSCRVSNYPSEAQHSKWRI